MPKYHPTRPGVVARVFQGVKYFPTERGYWRSTMPKEARMYLHRSVWIAANGPIPEGYDVHHIDEDKSNNELSNLKLAEHKHHSHHHKRSKCL